MSIASPVPRPYRHDRAIFQIGLQLMEMSSLLDFGEDHVPFMAAKRQRMRERPAQFYGSIAESLPAQHELLAIIAAHLRDVHAAHFRVDGTAVEDLIDGTAHRLDAPDREPLEIAADLTEEDLILLDEKDGNVIVTAASNAYSTTRRIVSSVGQSMRFAHTHVPGLNEGLGDRIDRVLGNLKAGLPVVRYNWSVVAGRERLAPSTAPDHSAVAAAIHADHRAAGRLLSLRSERQKFIRLPQSGKVAFLLYTFSGPLSDIRDDRESLAGIHRLLGDYSPERLRYSGMDLFKAPLMRWLSERLAALPQITPASSTEPDTSPRT